MVFLMGLSVAKEPIRDVICRGRTCQNVCVCVHVCAAWASCLKEAHLILFYRERQHIPVKLNGFSASVLPQT